VAFHATLEDGTTEETVLNVHLAATRDASGTVQASLRASST